MYTVQPRHDSGNYGSFSLAASQPRKAHDATKAMEERGVPDVEILDENGVPYDLAELERAARERETG
jgi:hypothetical protein